MGDTRELVHLCGWCPGAQAETQRLKAAGHEVTTGICSACRERVFGITEADVAARARWNALVALAIGSKPAPYPGDGSIKVRAR